MAYTNACTAPPIALPDSADPEGITASGFTGVLQVVIPKRSESQPRRIQVGTMPQS